MRHILAAVLAVLPVSALAQDGTPQPSVLVTTTAPHEGSLPRTLTAYGTVQAAPGSSETLSLLRAGQVTRVLVALGQTVRQGQPLLVVSADPAALAAFRQAVTALTLAQGERGRVAQMLAQHLATRDQLALADKAVTDAQGNLDVLMRAGGGSAGQTVAAPFDGVVSGLPVATGARIASQAPLVTLDRSSSLVAAVGIEPAQRSLVAGGQPVRIEPLDGGGFREGSVLGVGGMLDPATRLVPVLVSPQADTQTGAQSGAGLLPGGAVRVVVQVGEYRGWLVPRNAVSTDAKGPYLFQLAGGKAARVDVQVAGAVGDTTVVTGALDPRRPLVTTGNTQLQDGAAVREAAGAASGIAAQ
jgi:RND family efflux transporter MFP subunit